MNIVSTFKNSKFKNLDKNEFLQLVNFYIEENKYNCTPEYTPFEEYYNLLSMSGDYKRADIESYFINNFYPLNVLKSFYKMWR
ncbi:MAG: hypothetical protein QM499_01165 [Flavobacteriaceae bacterium]